MYRSLSYCSSPMLRLLLCTQFAKKPEKTSTRLIFVNVIVKSFLAPFLVTSLVTSKGLHIEVIYSDGQTSILLAFLYSKWNNFLKLIIQKFGVVVLNKKLTSSSTEFKSKK